MVSGKLEERMDRMCSYKHTHNGAVHTRHANYLRRLRDWWLGNHIKHKAIGGGLFWHQMNLDLLGYTNASMMTLEEARDFFGERTGEALYPGNKGESDNSGALIAMANMQTTLLSLNEWSGNLTIETDAMIAANNEIINNINNSVADREVMNLVIDGVISNDAINLPTYYHIAGADNEKRYREHVRYFSDGLDLDHYNLMNNPIVQAVHGATNGSAQFIREVVEAASLATGVGAVVRAGVGISVKLLARQAAKHAAKHAAKQSSKIVKNSAKQLQKKFKHANDFGVSGNFSKANAANFSSAINQHINNSAVKIIQGTYKGNPVIHYLNPNTGVNVMTNPNGGFISGWKLGQQQLQGVLNNGTLW